MESTRRRPSEAAALALGAALLAGPASAQCLTSKVTAPDAKPGDTFGGTVAIDGDRAVIASTWDDSFGTSAGSAYVFRRQGSNWFVEQKLFASDAANFDRFGTSVAIDGGTIAVAAPYDDDGGSDTGSIYVFERRGSAWVEVAKLHAADADSDDTLGYGEGGSGLALAGDTLVASGVHSFIAGAAYVFERQAGVWTQTAKLLPWDVANGFGYAVALDGDQLVVGDPANDASGNESGAVYVFRRLLGSWLPEAKLVASDGAAGDWLGWAVAASVGTIVASAHRAEAPSINSGAAYVFRRVAGVWSQVAKLAPSDPQLFAEFGRSVALDGPNAVVGAWHQDVVAGSDVITSNSGAAYAFHDTGAEWIELGELLVDDPELDDFLGEHVSISGDFALVGAWSDDEAAIDGGAAYTFSVSGAICPTLRAEPTAISLVAGGSQDLALTPGAALAGQLYWIAGSGSVSPSGLPIGGVLLPLTIDPYFLLTVTAPNQPPFVHTLGSLDASGQANARIDVPSGTDPALVGLEFVHCGVVFDAFGAIHHVSNPTLLLLRP